MPTINGVLETALYVEDLERSVEFYRRLFGFETLLETPGRLHAMNVAGRQVLLLFRIGASQGSNPVPGGVVPAHDGRGRLHVAFAISGEEVEGWRKRLSDVGVEVESTVVSPGGGMSLYFRDPDGHLIELATPGLWGAI